MKDLDVNLALWGMFLNTTLRAAVHLGKDYDMNLRFVEELSLENSGTAFQRNRKAGQWSGQTETAGMSLMNFQDLRWISTSFLHS